MIVPVLVFAFAFPFDFAFATDFAFLSSAPVGVTIAVTVTVSSPSRETSCWAKSYSRFAATVSVVRSALFDADAAVDARRV